MSKSFLALFFLVFVFSTNINGDSLKLSAILLKMDYVERDKDGEFLDSEKSGYDTIVGAELEYTIDIGQGSGGANKSELEFNLEYLNGQTDYDGFLQSNGRIISKHQTKTDIEIIKPRVRWSEIHEDEWYDVGVFASAGYRYWLRDIGDELTGIKEEYQWFYADVGIKTLFHENDWHLGLEFAYQRAYKPTLFAHINGGLEFDLGKTDGYNIKVPLIYDVSEDISLEVAYEFDHWEIEASDVVGGYFEPSSKTNNETIKMGLIIKW